jgi:hypothetical protein
MTKSDYIALLQLAFKRLHGCKATHVKTVPIIERWKSKTVWEGEVEVFDLMGHPMASRGYAWAHDKEKGSDPVAVLELPPITSPLTAVKAAIVGLAKERGRTTGVMYSRYFRSKPKTLRIDPKK